MESTASGAGKSELIINTVGCGKFQIIHCFFVAYLSYASLIFSNQFMVFGNYNPGWRCLDQGYNNNNINNNNHTTRAIPIVDNLTRHTDINDGASLGGVASSTTNNNNTNVSLENITIDDSLDKKKIRTDVSLEKNIPTGTSEKEYTIGDCSVYASCKQVEFNPDSNTLVTEWGLVCDQAWIPSLMISLQMIGFMIGTGLGGIMGDAFGRKLVIYVSMVFTLIFNVISIFSNSWQMYTAFRFLLGLSYSFYSTLYYVYMAEFVTIKWRAIALGMPCYPVGVVFFGITCYMLRDWRYIIVATSIVTVVGMVPAIILPESLRWLEVKNKTARFEKAAQQIARWNGTTVPPLEQMNSDDETKTRPQNLKHNTTVMDTIRYMKELFKREYRKYTITLAVPWISASLIYYAVAFGIKDLHGDFYSNLIISYAIEVVVDSFLMFGPNAFGRKKAGVAFCGFSGLCMLMAACFEKSVSGDAKFYGVTAPVMVSRISISAFYSVLQLFNVELYPTVARGAANSWGLFTARIGGILAPVLIPTQPSTIFICYAVMAALGVMSAILIMLLPETRGKILKEHFDDHQLNGNVNQDGCGGETSDSDDPVA